MLPRPVRTHLHPAMLLSHSGVVFCVFAVVLFDLGMIGTMILLLLP
jgi:hypothetical protein